MIVIDTLRAWWRTPRRRIKAAWRQRAREKNYRRKLATMRLRELRLVEIFPDIREVAIPVGAIEEDTLHPNHVDLLYVSAIAKHLGCRRIFEFGTFIGRTAYHLTLAHPEVEVFTLNLPPAQVAYGRPDDHGLYFRGTDRERFITEIRCDSRDLDTGPYRSSMDLVFVDGDHTAPFVKSDTEKAFEMLRPGGVVLWHDFAAKSPGVVDFMAEFTQEKPLFRIRNTCLLLYRDGVDPLDFEVERDRIVTGHHD